MTAHTAPAARVAAVRTIGAGIRRTDILTAEIVAALPDGFDHKTRGALAGFVSEWINGDSPAPAQKTGPKGSQTATDYGRGFDSLMASVKRALKDESPVKAESLTVTYVDADGKSHKISVTREMDAALYANLVSLANRADADSE